jgi:hypothetical protein
MAYRQKNRFVQHVYLTADEYINLNKAMLLASKDNVSGFIRELIDREYLRLSNAGVRLVIITKKNGEYRVPGPAKTEAQAYYTDDLDDALATAKLMYGGKILVKIKQR